MMTSVTTSDIANALCRIEVFTHSILSTVILVQYAEKLLPQMKTIEKKNEMVQTRTMRSMPQVMRLNLGAALLVKILR